MVRTMKRTQPTRPELEPLPWAPEEWPTVVTLPRCFAPRVRAVVAPPPKPSVWPAAHAVLTSTTLTLSLAVFAAAYLG